MKTNRTIALALSFALSISASYAQGDAMSFLRIARDPASAGMGFAGTASTSGTAWSAFRNASVIPLSESRMDIGLNWQSWAPQGAKSNNINFGSAFRIGEKFGLAVGAAYQGGESYSRIDETGKASGTFSPGEMIVSGGLGFEIINGLAVGINMRYASQKLAKDASYSAVCGDAFVTYSLKSLNISAGVSSFGTSVKGADGTCYSLPASATLGLDWTAGFAEAHAVRLAADADYFFSGAVGAAAGVQYSFKDMIFARAGYHYGSDAAPLPSFATVGLGVKFAGVQLNAAYLLASEALAGTLTIGLGYSF